VARAVKLAMTPLLNQMSVVGLVSIPGGWNTAGTGRLRRMGVCHLLLPSPLSRMWVPVVA
jgi:hypothetical protein